MKLFKGWLVIRRYHLAVYTGTAHPNQTPRNLSGSNVLDEILVRLPGKSRADGGALNDVAGKEAAK